MSRIVLIGGHGKIALLAMPLLVAAGHRVDGVIRNPDHADDVRSTGAKPVVADVATLDDDAMGALIRKHDIVVWCAGAGGGSPERTYAVDRDAAIASIDAAERSGVSRYLMVSYFGSDPEHGVSADDPFFAYAEAKAAADARLRDSDLDWTILAPSALTLDSPTGRIGFDRTSGQVSRADVAAVIAEVIGRRDLSGRTLRFNSGKTPISDALSAAL